MEKKLNILLAEDDENLGQLLYAYLQNKGFSVTLARTGKAAYEKYNGNKTQFDFLIFDVLGTIVAIEPGESVKVAIG